MEVKVTIDRRAEEFVAVRDGAEFRQSFDGVQDEIERVTIELAGRGAVSEDMIDNPHQPPRGTVQAWDHLQNMRERLRDVCSHQGESAVAGLSPQLTGLEGQAVIVVDEPGSTPRRITVAVSGGWMPHHLEIRMDGNGTPVPARIEYESVEEA